MSEITYGISPNIVPVTPPNFKDEPYEIFPARVKSIILNSTQYPDLFKNRGEWDSIGMIFFENVSTPTVNTLGKNPFAKPIFSNLLNYPLLNEIVFIISLPGQSTQNNTNNTQYYYFNSVNIWNSVHHNALPDNTTRKNPPKGQTQDYQQTAAGSVRRVTDKGTNITLGSTFVENLKIRDLKPFEGDVIFEGRFSNSIRLGSTVKDKEGESYNNWSENGKSGDPITIIRNGQPDAIEGETWDSITEDIYKDKSSIYLTTNQKIDIPTPSVNYNSYDTDTDQPIQPNEYIENQVVLNSGRLVFSAKDNHILLSANKSINLNSAGTLNFDSEDKLSINSPEMYFGNKENDYESLLLGDSTVESLSKIIDEVNGVFKEMALIFGNMGVPFLPLNGAAGQAMGNLTKIKNQLGDLKSKKGFLTKNAPPMSEKPKSRKERREEKLEEQGITPTDDMLENMTDSDFTQHIESLKAEEKAISTPGLKATYYVPSEEKRTISKKILASAWELKSPPLNYNIAPKHPGDKANLYKLDSLDPVFKVKIKKIMDTLLAETYKTSDGKIKKKWHPRIFYGFRSRRDQLVALKNKDSTINYSYHNVVAGTLENPTANGLAVDVIDRWYAWGEAGVSAEKGAAKFFKRFGALAKEEGLTWGGDWTGKTTKNGKLWAKYDLGWDPGHVEMSGKSAYRTEQKKLYGDNYVISSTYNVSLKNNV